MRKITFSKIHTPIGSLDKVSNIFVDGEQVGVINIPEGSTLNEWICQIDEVHYKCTEWADMADELDRSYWDTVTEARADAKKSLLEYFEKHPNK